MKERLERMRRGLAPRNAALAIVVGCTLAAFACADNSVTVGAGELAGDDDAGPSFAGADASGLDVSLPPDQNRRMCVATDCPSPFATCPVDGVLPEFRCGTDLSKDGNHCGACGNACGNVPGQLGMKVSCVDGQCEATCVGERLDCNAIVEDGCEANILGDPNNCGACGNRCPEGVCTRAKCGCPPGHVLCNGRCIRTDEDDYNCGDCGVVCDTTSDGGTTPPHMYRGCVEGTCGELKCDQRDGPTWTNCNALIPDGCEVNLTGLDDQGNLDSNNCGMCGKKCDPGTRCLAFETIDCYCKTGETLCNYAGCKDLETDPTNCGSCGFGCPDPVLVFENLAKGDTTCRRGHCGYACRDGFADCNERLDDGCESRLANDPRNCGACGNACATNQPCVNGACVTRECAEGDPQ